MVSQTVFTYLKYHEQKKRQKNTFKMKTQREVIENLFITVRELNPFL